MSGLNIRDAESAYLQALSEVEAWRAEIIREFLQPDYDLTLLTLWGRLPPDVHAQLKARNPEAYAQVDKQVAEAKERYKNGTINR